MITATYEQVRDRDRVCRFTRRPWPIEMNEIVPRSATRGLPPEQRFNTRNCLMLHRDVHLMFTRHVLGILPVDVDVGADGVVKFVLMRPDDPLWKAFVARNRDVPRWMSAP